MSNLVLSRYRYSSAERITANCRGLKELVDDETMARLRRDNTTNLLKEKKLMLILDLDNTLLHSTKDYCLSSEDERLVQLTESAEADRDKSIFKWRGMVTKLRPHVRSFLKEASTMYDMCIYTMGTREYAIKMAKFLDPEDVYFKNKVLSRENCSTPYQKGLDVVIGEQRSIVIIDDNDTVWGRHATNQIAIEKYHFFGPKRPVLDFDGNPLPEMEELESKYSYLMISLGLLKSIHQMFFDQAHCADFSDSDVRNILLCIRDDKITNIINN